MSRSQCATLTNGPCLRTEKNRGAAEGYDFFATTRGATVQTAKLLSDGGSFREKAEPELAELAEPRDTR